MSAKLEKPNTPLEAARPNSEEAQKGKDMSVQLRPPDVSSLNSHLSSIMKKIYENVTLSAAFAAVFLTVTPNLAFSAVRFCPWGKQQVSLEYCVKFNRGNGVKTLVNNCGRSIQFPYCELTSASSDPDSCSYSQNRATKRLVLKPGKVVTFSASESMKAWPHICR